jgi:glycosyltransferase involved in cell wall biosynthesis
MMHVLNVNSTLDLESGSGIAERSFQLCRRIAARGVRCTALALDMGKDAERMAQLKGVEVVLLPCAWRRFFVPRIGPGSLRRIRSLVRQADVVHLMGHWGLLNAVVYWLARREKKPYLYSPAGLLHEGGRSPVLKRVYNRVVGRRLLRDASGWIAVTSGEFPQFADYGIDAAKITVLPNGVEAEPARERGSADAEMAALAPYILYVGRLHHVKGPDLLLEAFREIGERHPEHRLVYIGPDDGVRASLEAEARRFPAGARVVFLGYRKGEQKQAAYRCADLLVIPSRREAMSLVVLEAAALATPVVLTDQCGFDEIARVDPRLLVPASSDGIARSVCSLLEDRAALSSLGAALRDYVIARFGWDRVIDRFLALCEEVA